MFSPTRCGPALGLALALAVSVAADDRVDLKAGDKAPAFAARDCRDRSWKSEEHVGKKWVVNHYS